MFCYIPTAGPLYNRSSICQLVYSMCCIRTVHSVEGYIGWFRKHRTQIYSYCVVVSSVDCFVCVRAQV